MAAPRRCLGNSNTIGSRARVFLTATAIEVDEYDGWHIGRRRVFLDDVVQVSRHRQRNWIGFWILLVISGLFFLGGVLGSLSSRQEADPWIPLVVCMIIASPLIISALCCIRSAVVVTVVGRRTRTHFSFWWKRSRAEAVFQELCDRIREAQAGSVAESPVEVASVIPASEPLTTPADAPVPPAG